MGAGERLGVRGRGAWQSVEVDLDATRPLGERHDSCEDGVDVVARHDDGADGDSGSRVVVASAWPRRRATVWTS